MRIAVTGGSGQIGRAVVALALAEGHQVVSVDVAPPPPPVSVSVDGVGSEPTFVRADVTQYAELESALRDCDALVHLAAIRSPIGRPDHEVHNTNVVASYNALSAAAHAGIERVCQASSINATGAAFSRQPRYDYFPLDESHPTYTEDPYSLSKWICEQQADSFARRYEKMAIASLRFHLVAPARPPANDANPVFVKHLWGYTLLDAAARACLQSLEATPVGHNSYYIVAPDTVMETPSRELHERYYPSVPLRTDLDGNRGFYDCSRAERLLGWRHDLVTVAS
jgi:UDP-glucose 4-epimerase